MNVPRKRIKSQNIRNDGYWVYGESLSIVRYRNVKLNRQSATEILTLNIRYGRVQRV